MPDRPVLITGAAGFAGRHLIHRLRGRDRLIGWFRPDAPPPSDVPDVAWRGVELTDGAAVARAVADARPSAIYHLAGAPSVETSFVNAVPHLQINALGTHHLLEAVRSAAPDCRVLVVTSAQIYDTTHDPIDEDTPLRPATPYGLTKLAQDQLARAAAADGLPVVIARPFNHAGPWQAAGFAVSSFARQIARIERGLDPPVLRVGNLEARRDIADVRDVVDAYVRLLERGVPGRAYNVCSGEARRMADILDALRAMSRVPVTAETDPHRLRPSDVPIIRGDATRLRTELGWAPRVPFDQTLRDTLDWWRTDMRE